jgi:hypothetical protein
MKKFIISIINSLFFAQQQTVAYSISPTIFEETTSLPLLSTVVCE